MRLLLLVAFATVAEARPSQSPQPLTCPNAGDECELDVEGKLVHAKRDPLAKWDNLRISTVIRGKPTLLLASINIPHRTRLKLKPGMRYRFTLAARTPFDAGSLWVIDAKRL